MHFLRLNLPYNTRNMIKPIVSLFLCCFLAKCSPIKEESIDQKKFTEIVNDIANGWNEGDASLSSKYFDEHAVYEEPPGKQLYKGRNEIFKFFGGDDGFEMPMKMKWHNLAFNEENQVGFGEYTFAMNNQYHGIVIMKFQNRKIVKWREYQYQSKLSWEDFARQSFFEEDDE